jgi:Secretion system C-terminal sorting domain
VVSPNSTESKCNITVPNKFPNVIHNVIHTYILNSQGQALDERKVILDEKHQFEVDLSNLPTGVYFIKTISEHETRIKKIIKSK